MNPHELRFTDTNSADDSKGRTWGLEGNLFWFLAGGTFASVDKLASRRQAKATQWRQRERKRGVRSREARRRTRTAQPKEHSTTQRRGKRDEAAFGLGELDDFQLEAVSGSRLRGRGARAALVDVGQCDVIARHGFNLGDERSDLDTILFVGGSNPQGEKVTQPVHDRVDFCAIAPLRSVVASARPARERRLHGAAVHDDRGQLASILWRTHRFSMSNDLLFFRAALENYDAKASAVVDDTLLLEIVASCRAECPDSSREQLIRDVGRTAYNVAYEALIAD